VIRASVPPPILRSGLNRDLRAREQRPADAKSPLMSTFLLCWLAVHIAAFAWVAVEVLRAHRK